MARTCNQSKVILKNNLRKIRLSKNISQEELAQLVSTSSITISYIENEKYTPNGLLMFLLAIALEVKVDELFYLAESSDVSDVSTHKRIKRR